MGSERSEVPLRLSLAVLCALTIVVLVRLLISALDTLDEVVIRLSFRKTSATSNRSEHKARGVVQRSPPHTYGSIKKVRGQRRPGSIGVEL